MYYIVIISVPKYVLMFISDEISISLDALDLQRLHQYNLPKVTILCGATIVVIITGT